MDDEFKHDVAKKIKGYLTSCVVPSKLGITALLSALEEKQFVYLPDPDWMLLVGYATSILGTYRTATYLEGEPFAGDLFYKVEVLSQTSLVLLFRNDRFVAAQPVTDDRQLTAFLTAHSFPAPACE